MVLVSSKISIKNSIATQLFKGIFSIYIAVAISITLIHMFAEYYNAKDEIYEEFGVFYDTFKPAIQDAVWNVDPDQVKRILGGVLKIPIIVGVRIEIPGRPYFLSAGTVLNSGEQAVIYDIKGNEVLVDATGLFARRFSLNYLDKFRDQEVMIGTVTLYSSTNVVFQKVKQGFIFILINSVIKSMALWAIFIVISRILLSRPLQTLTNAAQQVELDNLENFKVNLQLSGRNELTVLKDAFESMIRKLFIARVGLDESLASLDQANQRLTLLWGSTKNFSSSYDKFTILGKTTDAILNVLSCQPDSKVTITFETSEKRSKIGFANFELPIEFPQEAKPRVKQNQLKLLHHFYTRTISLKNESLIRESKTTGSLLTENILSIPIWHNRRLIGLIEISHIEPGVLTEEVKEFIDTLMQSVAIVLEDIRLNQQLRYAKFDLEELNDNLEKLVEARTQELKVEHERYKQSQFRVSQLGEMTASIVHDLKNPLGVILGFAELIGMDELPSEQKVIYLNRIQDESTRLIDMAHELLDFARDRIFIQKAEYNLGEFMKEMHRFLKNYFEDNIELKLELGYEGPLRFDWRKLRRAIYNLSTNANDALKNGGIFTITTEKKESFVEIRLEDNGPGIPEAIRENLFENFVTYGKPKGSGMGTTIAKNTIEAHGGEILFTTETNQGTTFIIRLPLD